MPLFERVRSIAADIFHMPRGRITLNSSAENIEAWDSLQHLNLILALEQEFDLQFEPEEIEKMNSLEQIIRVLEAKTKGGKSE
jgi:acyl carrier protein